MSESKKRTDIFHKPTGDEVIHDLIWTVPNFITLVRLLCIPLFVWLIFGPEERYIAAWLLGGLGATDWVDGYLARKLDQSSEIGRLLDPTVDRLMFIVGITALIIDKSVALWFALAVLFREIVVALVGLLLLALGTRSLDVTWLGKSATFGLMFTFPLFLAGHSGVAGESWYLALAWIIGLPSLVLSWWTAFTYLPPARAAIAGARTAKP